MIEEFLIIGTTTELAVQQKYNSATCCSKSDLHQQTHNILPSFFYNCSTKYAHLTAINGKGCTIGHLLIS